VVGREVDQRQRDPKLEGRSGEEIHVAQQPKKATPGKAAPQKRRR
jgi:hypothetical protein